MTEDELRTHLDEWWQRWRRRSPENCGALIEHRHEELSADNRQMVMDVNEHYPFKPDQPPIVAVASDKQSRFRLPQILKDYLALKADG
jgi:hypothetical protein